MKLTPKDTASLASLVRHAIITGNWGDTKNMGGEWLWTIPSTGDEVDLQVTLHKYETMSKKLNRTRKGTITFDVYDEDIDDEEHVVVTVDVAVTIEQFL